MEHKKLNRLVAGFVFLVSLVVYIKTLSDTVVFWDVGEFIAATYLLQIPHPPGSPLFLIIAKVFSMFPTAHDLAVRVHLVSPIASALTAAFLYLSIVKLVLLWKEKPATVIDRLAVYGSAAIGALSLTFSPTFWFNAEEAEVYGMSMLFVGMITYLSLRWNERADEPGNEKYILLICVPCRPFDRRPFALPPHNFPVHDDFLFPQIRIYDYILLEIRPGGNRHLRCSVPGHREMVPRLA